MNQLPDDLILEIVRRVPSIQDAVSFGATCKEYRALAHQAIMAREVKRSVLDSFTFVVHRLMTKNRSVHMSRGGFVNHFYLFPTPMVFHQGTSAMHEHPSRWSTYILGTLVTAAGQAIDTIVAIRLTVVPARHLRDWRFDFVMSFFGDNAGAIESMFEDDDQLRSVLYQVTSPEERRNATLALVASWYNHTRDVLGGRVLRSHKKKSWLPPAGLPSLYQYIRAAYPEMRRFICNLPPADAPKPRLAGIPAAPATP